MYSRGIEEAFEKRKAKLYKWVNEHPLRQIQWEATRRCDMQCQHCGSDCSLSVDDYELTESEIVKAFESIASHYPSSSLELLSITGGEPLLRNDLPNVIRRLRALGFSHITIQTNGNKLSDDPGLLPILVNAGISGLGINLDGLQDAHDRLRHRKGHFESMCRLARRIREETSLYLTITTVVSRINLDDLPRLAKVISDLGVPRWRLIELQPMGRAHKDDTAYLNRDNFRRLVDFVKQINLEPVQPSKSPLPTVELACTGWFGTELEGIIRPYIWHCHAGVSTLGIWSNGDIGGCTDIDHRRSEGNVRTDSIMEVWQDRFKQYRAWDRRRTGECRACDQWSWCHGGAFHLRTEENELTHCPYLLLHDNGRDAPTPYSTGETVK